MTQWFKGMCKFPRHDGQTSMSSLGTYEPLPQDDEESDDFDWWTKFYASVDKSRVNNNYMDYSIETCLIYETMVQNSFGILFV